MSREAFCLLPPGRHGDGGGLCLWVSPTGSKSWLFMWTKDGKWREMAGAPIPWSRSQKPEGRPPVAARRLRKVVIRLQRRPRKRNRHSASVPTSTSPRSNPNGVARNTSASGIRLSSPFAEASGLSVLSVSLNWPVFPVAAPSLAGLAALPSGREARAPGVRRALTGTLNWRVEPAAIRRC